MLGRRTITGAILDKGGRPTGRTRVVGEVICLACRSIEQLLRRRRYHDVTIERVKHLARPPLHHFHRRPKVTANET